MSRGRWIATAVIVATLLGLLGWQRVRQQEVARCLDDGGSWTGGIRASCVPGRPVILRRDLHRT